MADTCRHEWALGGDGCVNCGESWAALLHPEEELAPPERRGLNRLLASFPAAKVRSCFSGLAGREDEDPWLSVSLGGFKQPDKLRRFAIWKATGNVYELDEHGAVGEDPIIEVTPL